VAGAGPATSCMSAEVFLDTNVIVHAIDTSAPVAKRQTARRILRDGTFALSTQVVQEFYVTATRKLKKPLSVPAAARWVEQLCRSNCVSVDVALVNSLLPTRNDFRFHSGMPPSSRRRRGRVLTEDLSDGQRYGAVTNPFR
jgi:predicted nucleic acid-binding protein